MPEIDLTAAGLTDEEMEIARGIMVRGKDKGKVRASKPPLGDDNVNGEAAYVWRMVVFCISPKSVHQCMPVTADFDLPRSYWEGEGTSTEKRERRTARTKYLETIVDRIVATVPTSQWHGIARWGSALGY